MFVLRGERKVKSDSGTHKLKKENLPKELFYTKYGGCNHLDVDCETLENSLGVHAKPICKLCLRNWGLLERIQVIHNLLAQSGDLSSGCPVRRVANKSKMACEGSNWTPASVLPSWWKWDRDSPWSRPWSQVEEPKKKEDEDRCEINKDESQKDAKKGRWSKGKEEEWRRLEDAFDASVARQGQWTQRSDASTQEDKEEDPKKAPW